MKFVRSKKTALKAEGMRGFLFVVMAALWLDAGAAVSQTTDLVSRNAFRVCADPANPPFSTKEETGFENKLAELFAKELGVPVQYTWFPMATGFVRRTLKANRCDVIMGFAQGHELVLNTNHYYTSAYVIVTRADSDFADIDTIADPRLKGRPIGVVAGTPPATHMARNGLMADVRPYHLVVDTRVSSPSEQMIQDLEKGKIDAAFMWGPIAGPLVKAANGRLVLTPLLKEKMPPRMFYRITMGVRQGDLVWKRELNRLIRRKQADIDRILTEYGVPLLDDMGQKLKGPVQ